MTLSNHGLVAVAAGLSTAQHRTRIEKLGLLLLWGYLVSPLLLYVSLNGGRPLRDMLWLYNGVTTLLWVGALHCTPWRPLRVHLLMLPLYVATAIDLFLVGVFGNRLSSAYMAIMQTDSKGADELFSAYGLPVLLTTLVLLAVLAVGLWCIRHAPGLSRPRRLAAFLAALVLGYTALFARNMRESSADWQANMLDIAGKEMSSPMGAVFQFGLTQYVFHRYDEMRAQRGQHRFEARQTASLGDSEIVVWIIGESSRPMNWQLFGYERPTNPLLSQIEGIVPLPRLRATATTTSYAVPSMLSLRPIDQWDQILAERSIVSAFAEAGFSTWWLSAQEVDSWAGAIPHVAAEAARRQYFDRSQDGAMLPTLQKIACETDRDRKTLVVVHTKGSHFDYKRRYPAAFARFDSGKTDRRSVLVDSYDNSVLYTDWFLARMIDILKLSKRRAALVYASDHGENLLDDGQQLFGHALSTRYDLSTAGFMWFSPEMQAARRDAMQQLRQHATAPITLSDLPHSVLNLAGIEAKGLDVTRSLFSPDFKAHPPIYRYRSGEIFVEPVTH